MLFYHAYLFSLVKSTLITVINRSYLKGFPGLTTQRACRHITIKDATEKGHMDQTRQGQWSTYPTLVVSHLDMNCTKVLMYHTMVLMACLTKVRR